MINVKTDRIISIILFLLLTIFTFYRGMYFRENYIISVLIIGFFYLLVLIMNTRYKKEKYLNMIDWSVIFFTIAYAMSFIFSVSKKDGLDGLLVASALYFCYYIGKYVTDIDESEHIIWLLGASAVVISLISILGATGLFKAHGYVQDVRLMGPYQYANSAASIYASFYIIISTYISKRNKPRFMIYLSPILIITMLALFLTKSRGGLLVFFVAYIFSFIIIDYKAKLISAALLVITCAASLAIYNDFNSAMANGILSYGAIVKLLIIAIISSLIFYLLTKKIDKLDSKIIKRILVGLTAVSILSLGFVLNYTEPISFSEGMYTIDNNVYNLNPDTKYKIEFSSDASENNKIQLIVYNISQSDEYWELFNRVVDTQHDIYEFSTQSDTKGIMVRAISVDKKISTIESIRILNQDNSVAKKIKLKYKLIPYDLGKKINEFNISTRNAVLRFDFVRDGFIIWKDHFVFGAGGNAWENLYKKYQSNNYNSNEAHNFYIQTAVETGLIGIVALFFLLILLFVGFVKLRGKLDESEKYVVYPVFVGLIVLFMHAAIDLDFSLYAITYFAWTYLGVLSSYISKKDVLPKMKKCQTIYNAICYLLSGSIILSGMFIIGMMYGSTAIKNLNTDREVAKEYYRKASRLDFYNTTYIADLNMILELELKQNIDKNKIIEVYNNYKHIERLDPYKTYYYNNAIQFYVNYGFLDDSDRLFKKYIEVQPLNPDVYEGYSNYKLSLFEYCIKNNMHKEAIKHLDELIEVERIVHEINNSRKGKVTLSEKTLAAIEFSKLQREILQAN